MKAMPRMGIGMQGMEVKMWGIWVGMCGMQGMLGILGM